MTQTDSDNGSRRGTRSGHGHAAVAGVGATAIGMLLGFLFWRALIPVMTMGTANCSDSSGELVCNYTLMKTLAFASLAGLALGFLLPLTLGIWNIIKKKNVAPTLIVAWAIAALPMLIFIGAGWNPA